MSYLLGTPTSTPIYASPIKTVKSTLLKILEENAEALTTIPPGAAWFVDAMAILQVTKTAISMIYSELVSTVFTSIIRSIPSEGCIDWVFDAYPEVCIKNIERYRRSTIASGSLTTRIRSGAQKVDQQMKKSMRSGAFKASLTQFLLQEWLGKEYPSRLEKRTLFVTGGDKCFRLTADESASEVGQIKIAALRCTQEEADTRMLLHAAHAADRAIPAMVIRSPDSDVTLIALSITHHSDTQLIFRRRIQHRARYRDLTAIARGRRQEICNALPGYHASTGCDSTSAFTGRGKVSSFRLLKVDYSFRSAMADISHSASLQSSSSTGEQAICTLYSKKQLTTFGTQTSASYHLATACTVLPVRT